MFYIINQVVAANIVNACVVLHNMCITDAAPDPEEEDNVIDYGVYEPDELPRQRDNARVNPDLLAARQLQRNRILNHFLN